MICQQRTTCFTITVVVCCFCFCIRVVICNCTIRQSYLTRIIICIGDFRNEFTFCKIDLSIVGVFCTLKPLRKVNKRKISNRNPRAKAKWIQVREKNKTKLRKKYIISSNRWRSEKQRSLRHQASFFLFGNCVFLAERHGGKSYESVYFDLFTRRGFFTNQSVLSRTGLGAVNFCGLCNCSDFNGQREVAEISTTPLSGRRSS